MSEASDLTTLTIKAISRLIKNGELTNQSPLPDCVMLDKAEVERLSGQIHILEFYDEFDDELKLREQNTILGRDDGSDGD
jgi:hypothetical protein